MEFAFQMNTLLSINDPAFYKPIFAISSLPTVEYISMVVKNESIIFEQHEHFIKQNNRSRYHILSANGLQTLHIPVQHNIAPHIKITDVKISHFNNWQRLHWRSIEAAYNRSPFFEFYKDEFKSVFFGDEQLLFNYNLNLMQWVFKALKIAPHISFTSNFETEINSTLNFKNLSNSKNNTVVLPHFFVPKKYQQVFGYKHDYVANLSVIDLIFNCGNNAKNYL